MPESAQNNISCIKQIKGLRSEINLSSKKMKLRVCTPESVGVKSVPAILVFVTAAIVMLQLTSVDPSKSIQLHEAPQGSFFGSENSSNLGRQ